MYYIGIDGGGTKTSAVLSNLDASDLRTVKIGTGNIIVLDQESRRKLIEEIFDKLLKGEDASHIQWATFAFAGAGREDEKKSMSNIISAAGIKNFTILTDAEILHYSIFGEKSGILISAGTGSVCIIRTDDEKYKQIGGWGYLLGDEGSGYYIGREAIKMALFEFDEKKQPSPLSKAILTFYQISHPGNLISLIYTSKRPQKVVASSAKTICEMADKGDSAALKIIENAAKSLIDLALEAIKILDHHTTHKHIIALTGGILQNSTIVNRAFREQSSVFGLNFEYLTQELDPAAAGVLYSLKECQKSVPTAVLVKLKQIKFSE